MWLSQDGRITSDPATYLCYRFPTEVIRRAVWLYHCSSLNLRHAELILAARGIIVTHEVTHESIRRWCARFGQDFARHCQVEEPARPALQCV